MLCGCHDCGNFKEDEYTAEDESDYELEVDEMNDDYEEFDDVDEEEIWRFIDEKILFLLCLDDLVTTY